MPPTSGMKEVFYTSRHLLRHGPGKWTQEESVRRSSLLSSLGVVEAVSVCSALERLDC